MYNNNEENHIEPLYCKIQRFYVKSSSCEERSKELRITVDFTSSYKVSKQVLNIQVCDDEDPFFYYSLMLTEDDYQRLKTTQGLLVDFDNFPAQVIRLLEQCKHHENQESKFLLLLEEERNEYVQTFLKIVEANNFKHLCHLVIQIEPGNDDDIKKLMLKKIKLLKDNNFRAEKLINNLESQLQNKSKQLQSTEEKLYQVQEKWKEERITFKAESTKEITEETEKFRKIQLDWQIRSQREKADLEEKYETIIKDKETELSRLRLENQILLEKKGNSDTTIADQARRLDHVQRDLCTLQNDFASSRKHCSKLEYENHEKEKSINSLKTKIAVVEQESKDKTILMNKQQELLNLANEQKGRLEEVITEKDKNIQRKQGSLQNLSDELIKANEIITKLQKELTNVNAKMKVRTSIALEQEKVVESHLRNITKLEEANDYLQKKLTTASESEMTTKTTISELKDLLETKDKKIKDNERIIDWLNRRLTEQSKSSLSTSGGNVGQTSTPYTRYSNSETNVSRVPFSSRVASVVSNISHLDQLQTPTIPEETENTTPNMGNDKIESQENKKSPVLTTSKPEIKKVSRKPGIGFKRASPGQTSTVPSSYFLK